jgi:S1-C subfamily serine protease
MNKVVLALIGCALLAAFQSPVMGDELPEAVIRAEQQRIEAVGRAVKSAVAVFSADGNGGGSGVVITPDGYALTNFHVVAPVGDYMKCGMADGRMYDAVLVSIDPTGDVALIKLFGRDDFPVAEMADSDDVQVGDWCFAVGNPFLLATNLQPTVTYGIVSGTHRYQFPAGTILEYADCIQTDAAINPGNSGGPLFNADGKLIGVNGRGSFEKRGRVNVGLGYAISINQIKHFLGHLHSGRIVDHATLGATVGDDEDGRVVVTNILDASDAYRRGLRYGDEVVAFGGRTITSANAFKNVLGIYPKGWKVPLSFRRDGERHDVRVRLAGVHAREELLAKIRQAPVPDEPKERPGKPMPDEPKPDKPPVPAHAPQVKVPEAFAQYIKKRDGFANYYFNELNRTRVWNAFHDFAGDFATLKHDWTLIGVTAEQAEVTITLGQDASRIQAAGEQFEVNHDKDLSEQLAPDGSGGMLVALHLWRRMMVEGPQRFGDVIYLGKSPVIDREGLADVLAATYNVVETGFLFDPADGMLVSIEMAPEPDVDRCEIHFFDYKETAGRKLPTRLRVQHGERIFLDLELREIRLPNTEKSET